MNFRSATAPSRHRPKCPYCGETTTISVDPGGGSGQQYMEDCEGCCNPWQVTVPFDNGITNVQVATLDA